MIPSTLSGLLVFLASVGPGYLYVQVAERYRPPRDRSTIREIAEIVVTGSLATLVGVITALIVTRLRNAVDTQALVQHPGTYVPAHPGRTGLALAVVLVSSYGIAFLVARFAPGKGPRVSPIRHGTARSNATCRRTTRLPPPLNWTMDELLPGWFGASPQSKLRSMSAKSPLPHL